MTQKVVQNLFNIHLYVHTSYGKCVEIVLKVRSESLCTKNFHKVATVPQMVVHVSEVGVDMVSIPTTSNHVKPKAACVVFGICRTSVSTNKCRHQQLIFVIFRPQILDENKNLLVSVSHKHTKQNPPDRRRF